MESTAIGSPGFRRSLFSEQECAARPGVYTFSDILTGGMPNPCVRETSQTQHCHCLGGQCWSSLFQDHLGCQIFRRFSDSETAGVSATLFKKPLVVAFESYGALVGSTGWVRGSGHRTPSHSEIL